jgi:hypothetical protein
MKNSTKLMVASYMALVVVGSALAYNLPPQATLDACHKLLNGTSTGVQACCDCCVTACFVANPNDSAGAAQCSLACEMAYCGTGG